MSYIIWIDEAWRWPWAWPVVATAVCFMNLKKIKEIRGFLDDSKKLSKKKRQISYDLIKLYEEKWYINIWIWIISNEIIDGIWIKPSNKKAMEKALEELLNKIWENNINKVLIDGNDNYKFKNEELKYEFIIRGDSKIDEIKAASIIAKVTRDKIMEEYNTTYPWFDFSSHSWYWTKKHRQSIFKLWICPIHRKSFKPIKEFIENNINKTWPKPKEI